MTIEKETIRIRSINDQSAGKYYAVFVTGILNANDPTQEQLQSTIEIFKLKVTSDI